MKRYELTVADDCCSTCELLLERTVGQRSVVTSVDIDVDTSTGVVYATPDTRDQLIETIRTLSFTIDD